MNLGLFSAYLGMRARQQRLDLIANNIANASTTGFKADRLFYRSIEAAEKEMGHPPSSKPGEHTPPPAQPQAPASPATPPPDPNAPNQNAATTSQVQNGRDLGVMTTPGVDFSQGALREPA